MKDTVVFYDGDCGFCNRSVQFILDHEKTAEIQFCALQSNSAIQFFESNQFGKPDLSTFYFWNGYELLNRSSGALAVVGYLKFPYRLAVVFKIVPRFIRDAVYNAIAKRRHRLFPKNCVVLSEEQKARFF